jgi:hypothetical protein
MQVLLDNTTSSCGNSYGSGEVGVAHGKRGFNQTNGDANGSGKIQLKGRAVIPLSSYNSQSGVMLHNLCNANGVHC